MRITTTILTASIILTACAKAEDETADTVQDTTTAVAPAPAPAAAPTDPEIAHIAVTANTIDVEAGQLAKQKSTNKEVTAFADRMITDHTAVNKQATDLATKLGVTPADNATSQSLLSGAAQAKTDLSSKSGADFDRAYIAHEVTYHQQVLDALDQTLIPNTQNAELKALLEQVRPAVAAHLEMAKQLQTKLGQ